MKRTALKRRTPLKRKRSKPTKRAPRRVGNATLILREPAMGANARVICDALGERQVEFLLVQSEEGSIYHVLVTDQGEAFSALEVVDIFSGRMGVVCDAWPLTNRSPEARYTEETVKALRSRAAVGDPTRAGTSKEGE